MSFSLRTRPPMSYIPPTRDDMKAAAQAAGLRGFAPDFVEDLCNLAAGGTMNAPSSYRSEVERLARERTPQYNDEAFAAWDRRVANETEKRMRYHQSVCDFAGTLDFGSVPGATPLEQAMNLLKLLATQKGGQPGGGDGETLPIFVDNPAPEKVAENLNSVMEQVETLSGEERELLDPDGEHDSSAAGDGGEDPKQAVKLAEDMLKGKEIMLRISRNLDKLTRMKVSRQIKLEPDPEGDERRLRPLEHFGELMRIPQSAWALPRNYRNYLAVTQQLPVRERVTKRERKQLLYVICDCSGSMGSGQRLYKAGGIVMNRLKAVIDGDAELWFRWFDTGLKKRHEARTAEEARALIKEIARGNSSGGGTAIANCVRAAVSDIQELATEDHWRPELVVISDGDDCSSLRLADLQGVRLHAFVVENKNEALCRAAQASGGVGVQQF